jgi:hypothetical protein
MSVPNINQKTDLRRVGLLAEETPMCFHPNRRTRRQKVTNYVQYFTKILQKIRKTPNLRARRGHQIGCR